MNIILSRDEIRSIDKKAIEEYGIPGCVLMENAGRNMAEYLLLQDIRGPIILCAGKGNNGGDAYVIARYLDNHQIPISVFVFAAKEEIKGDALIHYQVLEKMGIYITHITEQQLNDANFQSEIFKKFQNAEWIVDGILGTGLLGSMSSFYTQVITLMNNAQRKILAIDIPSGLDCDTGEPLGSAIRAHTTLTVIAAKKGFSNYDAKKYIGHCEVIDIGIPRRLFTKNA